MNPESQQPRVGRRFLLVAGLVAGIVALVPVIIVSKSFFARDLLPPDGPLVKTRRDAQLPQKPMMLAQRKHLTVWWDTLPESIRSRSQFSRESNIHPADYTGPSACRQCHSKNYEAWSTHPHRFMNMPANAACHGV